jgi:protein-tyrosine phosphatase
MLQQRLPNKSIRSAGLRAMSEHRADRKAAQLARKEGLDIDGHKARQLTKEMIQQADLILVMTQGQRTEIAEKYPASVGKVMLFGQWLRVPGEILQGRDIPDPFMKSQEVFELVHRLLAEAADAWQKRL